MRHMWSDKRLFCTVVAIVASFHIEAAPYIAAIVCAYMGNRAYVEGKGKTNPE